VNLQGERLGNCVDDPSDAREAARAEVVEQNFMLSTIALDAQDVSTDPKRRLRLSLGKVEQRLGTGANCAWKCTACRRPPKAKALDLAVRDLLELHVPSE
jgi:hypothetical protein